MTAAIDPARFEVDAERGFLPAADPLDRLPHAFAAWDELGAELPKLLGAGAVQRTIEAMPELDPAALPGGAERRRAMMLLSYLGHAYVWGEPSPVTALPWAQLATALGRPPVLSYASYALDNWRRLDASGPVALGNIGLLQNFLGGIDEEWFILVHVEIEAEAAPGLQALAAAASAEHGSALEPQLARLERALGGMLATLERMPEHCDPYIYFHRVRPYIHGWRDHPALPGGLIYEGVAAFGDEPQRFRGETGAQSSIVPAVDATLGVRHEDDTLAAYLREMRDYMPAPLRSFVTALAERSRVRELAAATDSGSLRDVYNACIERLAAFRALHLEYAGRYIYAQSRQWEANPATVGTGGTPFIPYLSKHHDETLAHLLS
jgi:indoleamine 2,3-dioxygenase